MKYQGHASDPPPAHRHVTPQAAVPPSSSASAAGLVNLPSPSLQPQALPQLSGPPPPAPTPDAKTDRAPIFIPV